MTQKISEIVAIGMAMEEEERKRFPDMWKRGLEAALAKRAGREVPEADAPPPEVRKRVCAAIGMKPYSYYRACKVVRAARDFPRYAPLVDKMDRTLNINGVYDELVALQKGLKVRPEVLRKMQARKPNREMQRSVDALGGICIVLKDIPVGALEKSQLNEWSAALKSAAGTILNIVREIKRHGNETAPESAEQQSE